MSDVTVRGAMTILYEVVFYSWRLRGRYAQTSGAMIVTENGNTFAVYVSTVRRLIVLDVESGDVSKIANDVNGRRPALNIRRNDPR